MRRYVVLVCALALVGGCAANGDEVVAEVANATAATVATAPTSPTSTAVAPTYNTSAPESPTTTTENALRISDVAGWVQDWLDASFDSEIDWILVGASRIRCSDSGWVLPGDVFACEMVPQPAQGWALETAGVVVYVLDNLGRAVWRSGDVPDSTAELHAVYDAVPEGMLCRDLASQDLDVALFHSDWGLSADGFFWSLVYWSLDGQPERMDADHNGIPCETLYDPAVVTAVLEGGPIGGHEPPPLGLVLRPAGLGPFSFGDRMDDVLPILTDLLGTPTSDEVHTDVWSRFDASGEEVPFGYYRRVGWSPQGLYLEFVDWDINLALLDRPVLTYWTASGPLWTAEGVGPGSLWADMAAIYGNDAKAWSEDCGEDSETMYFFSVRHDGELWYHGWLTDDPTDRASSVTRMDAGIEAFSQGC